MDCKHVLDVVKCVEILEFKTIEIVILCGHYSLFLLFEASGEKCSDIAI